MGKWLGIWLGVGLLGLTVSSAQAAAVSEKTRLSEAVRFVQSGQLEKGADVFRELTRDHPAKGLYWFNLGQILAKQRKTADAIACFQKVIELQSPLSPAARLGWARAAVEKRDFEAASTQHVALSQAQLPPNLRAQVEEGRAALYRNFMEWGLIYYKREDFRSALIFFERAQLIESDPQGTPAQTMRAMSLYRLGDVRRASALLKETELRSIGLRGNWGIFETYGSFQSNPFAVSALDGPESRAIVGAEGFVRRPWTTQASGNLTAGYEEWVGLSEERLLKLGGGLEWIASTEPGSWSIQPRVSLEWRGGDAHLLRSSISAGGEVSKAGNVIALFHVSRALSLSGVDAYLSGTSLQFLLSKSGERISDFTGLRWRWGVQGGWDAFPDITLTSGATIPSSGPWAGPLAYGTWIWPGVGELDGRAALAFHSYTTPAQPAASVRRDVTLQLAARFSREWTPGSPWKWGTYLSSKSNFSTLSDTSATPAGFQQWVVGSFLSWESPL